MYDSNDSAKANVYPIETNAGYVYFNFFSKKNILVCPWINPL